MDSITGFFEDILAWITDFFTQLWEMIIGIFTPRITM